MDVVVIKMDIAETDMEKLIQHNIEKNLYHNVQEIIYMFE